MSRRTLSAAAPRSIRPRCGFTLVEATIALLVTGLAASALLLSLTASAQSSDEAVRRQVAAGIARTLMDELSGMRYMEFGVSPFDSSLVPGSDETPGPGRSRYDDIDDYNGLRNQPPRDRNGQSLGNENGDTAARDPRFRVPAALMSRWKVDCDVFYVAENAWLAPLSNHSGTNYRTARVRVWYVPLRGSTMLMSEVARTFAYVPEP